MTDTSRWTRPLARMSTGQKILLVLALALMPIGLLAIYSSVETARSAQETRDNTARLLTEVSAARLSNAIARTAISLRAASTAVAIADPESGRCAATLNALAGLEEYDVRYAIFDDAGNAVCATPGFAPQAMAPPRGSSNVITRLDTERRAIRFVVAGANRRSTGIAELPADTLERLTRPDSPVGPYRITVSQSGSNFPIHEWRADQAPDRIRTAETEVANGQLAFTVQFGSTPMRFAEALTIALPILMWLAAALLGWWAVDRMIVRPLGRLRAAVAKHSASGGEFRLPDTRTPAMEIRELGQAFQRALDTLQENERQLEEGLAEQQRLIREVHHRVKNNLQVVASLLNLHARAAASAETAAAYASIQRRVDALAIVQRNLFSEADARDGVAIRPVIAELASGLQQGAPDDVDISITIELTAVRVAQDIAAPVAFFITELVELAMSCQKVVEIDIRLEKPDEEGLAPLTLHSEALRNSEEMPVYARYRRVLMGLARQLRTNIERNAQGAELCVEIPTL